MYMYFNYHWEIPLHFFVLVLELGDIFLYTEYESSDMQIEENEIKIVVRDSFMSQVMWHSVAQERCASNRRRQTSSVRCDHYWNKECFHEATVGMLILYNKTI